MRVAPAIALTKAEQNKLEKISRSRSSPQRLKERSSMIFLAAEGLENKEIAQRLRQDRNKVGRWRQRYANFGFEGIVKDKTRPSGKPNLQGSDRIKNAVFTLLHSPPSQHNINRTSWRLVDLRLTLSQQGILISETTIRRIVKAAGYMWRKATEVLTSNDPEYQEKLDRIKSVLSTLRENDRFCSIDEYGPFGIKMRGGTRLVGPDEHPHVPQFQKAKGRLIVTAALELSRNQVTHFYSQAKNTTEMIKLLDVLLEKYSGCDTLYLSWDAASWHASEELYEKVKSVNMPDLWRSTHAPHVELIPLPSSA